MLFCTDVSSMGVHTENLCVGVSLGKMTPQFHGWKTTFKISLHFPGDSTEFPGVPTDRWHLVQQSGRLGRDPSSQAIYITIHETNKSVRGKLEEFKYILFIYLFISGIRRTQSKKRKCYSVIQLYISVPKEMQEEYKAVKTIFKNESTCIREKMYSSFKLIDPTGHLHTMTSF